MIYRTLLLALFIIPTLSKAQSVFVEKIEVEGNKKTKDFVILREVILQTGSSYALAELPAKIKTSQNRVLNLNLFNSVDISYNQIAKDTVIIHIRVLEKWYFWPIPFVEFSDRNFNVWGGLDFDPERTNYGIYLFNYNLFGRNHTLKTRLKAGYNDLVGIDYRIPFLSPTSNWGIDASVQYSSQNEVWYRTRDDSLRFYKNGNKNLVSTSNLSAEISKRTTPYVRVFYGLGFEYSKLDSAVPSTDYFVNDLSYQRKYRAHVRLESDKRDNIYFPLVGSYVTLTSALEAWQNKTTVPNVQIVARGQRFDKIAKRTYTAISFFTEFNSNIEPPYSDAKLLGYDEIVRGFEQYVIDGNFGWKGNAAIRYHLINKPEIKLPFIPIESYKILPFNMYLELYGDGGYVDNERPHMSNKLQSRFIYSGGIGLNTLFYNDRLLRLEYSLNSLKEGGFFVHFKKAI